MALALTAVAVTASTSPASPDHQAAVEGFGGVETALVGGSAPTWADLAPSIAAPPAPECMALAEHAVTHAYRAYMVARVDAETSKALAAWYAGFAGVKAPGAPLMAAIFFQPASAAIGILWLTKLGPDCEAFFVPVPAKGATHILSLLAGTPGRHAPHP